MFSFPLLLLIRLVIELALGWFIWHFKWEILVLLVWGEIGLLVFCCVLSVILLWLKSGRHVDGFVGDDAAGLLGVVRYGVNLFNSQHVATAFTWPNFYGTVLLLEMGYHIYTGVRIAKGLARSIIYKYLE